MFRRSLTSKESDIMHVILLRKENVTFQRTRLSSYRHKNISETIMEILFINFTIWLKRNCKSCDVVLYSINNSHYEFCFHYHCEHIDKAWSLLPLNASLLWLTTIFHCCRLIISLFSQMRKMIRNKSFFFFFFFFVQCLFF